MAEHNLHTDGHGGTEIAPPQTKAIWRTFIILSALTAVEFVIVYILPSSGFRIAIFAGMTVIKAFFIVGEFMHLKAEAKGLIWAILLPIIFVCWLLLALMMESGSIFQLR